MKTPRHTTNRKPIAALALVLILNGFAWSQTAKELADREYSVGATLWQQSSGEHRALCYQAFALARLLLDRDLKSRTRQRRAIIVDVDDTMLDTSRYEAWLVKENKSYPQEWTDWINRAEFPPVPGAVEFLNYANSRGVQVFYVTNRRLNEKDGTARNLRQAGFPAVNDQTLLVRTDPQSDTKEPRRREIGAKYHVVLLMGDDLNDFSGVFELSRTAKARLVAADQNKNQFGARFIVLPNPMYGNWENSLYEYNFKLSEKAKSEKRHSLLKE
jgi:5'-nucleotidase (lipoprotein e(P4) family)